MCLIKVAIRLVGEVRDANRKFGFDCKQVKSSQATFVSRRSEPRKLLYNANL